MLKVSGKSLCEFAEGDPSQHRGQQNDLNHQSGVLIQLSNLIFL